MRGILTTKFEGSPYGKVFKEADVIRLSLSAFSARGGKVEMNTNDEYKCGRGHGTRAAAAAWRLFFSSGSGSGNTANDLGEEFCGPATVYLYVYVCRLLVPTNFGDSTLPLSWQAYLDARDQGHSRDTIPLRPDQLSPGL